MNAPPQSAHRSDDLTLRILEHIAERTGTDPEQLPPIYSNVDPDVFELVCGNDRYGTDLEVRFTYCEHEVVVNGAGEIAIAELA